MEEDMYFLDEEDETQHLLTLYEASLSEHKKPIYLDDYQVMLLSDYYMEHRNVTNAMQVAQYGLTLHPDNDELLTSLASIYYECNNFTEAHYLLASITTPQPESVLLEAELFLFESNLQQANRVVQKLPHPLDEYTLIKLICLFFQANYPKEAKKWIDKGLKLYPDSVEIALTESKYEMEMGNYDEAIQQLNKLIDTDPFNATLWNFLASCYLLKESYDKVIEACDYAIVANDNEPKTYYYRCKAYLMLENVEKAMEDLDRFIEFDFKNDDSNTEVLICEIAAILIGLSEFEKASIVFKKNTDLLKDKIETALSVEEKNLFIELLLESLRGQALSLYRIKAFDLARLICKEIKKIDPEDSTTYQIEGQIFLSKEQKKEAIEAFEKSFNSTPTTLTLYEICSIFIEHYDLNNALVYAQRAYDMNPDFELAKKLTKIIKQAVDQLNNCGQEVTEEQFKKIVDEITKQISPEDILSSYTDLFPNLK
ncbi:MAG: tetratricopeptide repeat protein [Bacteroidia bacterium]|nr:tetratricopeptide repeat protein [Bacteroidia bacterium]